MLVKRGGNTNTGDGVHSGGVGFPDPDPTISEGSFILIDPATQLVCVNGTSQGNTKLRCGPYYDRYDEGGGVVVAVMHVYVDHSVIEVIVNNITALAVSVAPSGPDAAGVLVLGAGCTSSTPYGSRSEPGFESGPAASELSAHADLWQLEAANNI